MVAINISHSRPRPAVAAAARPSRVVPQSVRGYYRNVKWLLLIGMLAVYYITPFLRWQRGPGEPSQAVLLDFANGRLYAFFIELWPQDLYFVTGLLVLAVFVLIFTNAVGGRLWCGFACPQTVWTDLFLLVERWIEGDRRDRLKKADAPLTARRIAEIAAKHAAWLAIAFATGGAVVFYFTDAPSLVRAIISGEASLQAWVWIGIFAGTTYLLAGFAREQVCTFMCPWPRLQGAIWDPDAFTVNYRDYRGEQRMSAKKANELRAAGQEAGDCVDCRQCVHVCPIGIDIREGPNFACINCGLCVDACDSIMTKLGRTRGLIDFESWTNIERGRRKEPRAAMLMRPKTIGLGAACVLLAGGMAFAFSIKSDVSMTLLHEQNPRAVLLSDGAVRNGYMVKLSNKSSQTRRVSLRVDGIDARIAMQGADDGFVLLAPDSSETIRVLLTAPPADRDIRFMADIDGRKIPLSAPERFIRK